MIIAQTTTERQKRDLTWLVNPLNWQVLKSRRPVSNGSTDDRSAVTCISEAES